MPRLLTVNQFCEAYAMGRTRLYSLLAQHKLKAVKCGRLTMIDAESAEAWLASLPRFQSASAAAQAQA